MQQSESWCCLLRPLGSDSISHLEYDFYRVRLKEKRQHKIGIAVWKSSDFVRDNTLHQSERLMAVDIIVHAYKKEMRVPMLCVFMSKAMNK